MSGSGILGQVDRVGVFDANERQQCVLVDKESDVATFQKPIALPARQQFFTNKVIAKRLRYIFDSLVERVASSKRGQRLVVSD